MERSTLRGYYPDFVERSTFRGYYPHFTEISTFCGYWTLVRTFPASIDFCDLYWYVPRSSLGHKIYSSLCSVIASYRRHNLQEMQPLTVLQVTVGITTGKGEELDTPRATGVRSCGFFCLNNENNLQIEVKASSMEITLSSLFHKKIQLQCRLFVLLCSTKQVFYSQTLQYSSFFGIIKREFNIQNITISNKTQVNQEGGHCYYNASTVKKSN